MGISVQTMQCTRNSLSPNTELYTYEFFSHNDVCRLCWQRNSFQEMANKIVLSNGIKVEVLSVIKECLDVDLCGDIYPNKVCDQCWDIVKKFYTFKVYCKEADIKVREIIDTGPTILTDDQQIKSEIKDVIKKDLLNNAITLTNKPENRKVKTNLKAKKRSFNYCYICCSEFEDRTKFVNHNTECHGIENGTYKCFGCEKKFKNTRTRTNHETNFCKALKQGYKCLICGRFLPLRKLYEAHMRYHAGKETDVVPELSENIFKCRKCEESFKTKDNLKEHMTIHNSIDNHYVCETCGHVFLRHDYLQKHRLIHQGVKRYECPHCGLRFVQKSSLNVHLRKHTGERPYECDMCPQRCVSSSNLRAHRRRHLGLKQFECAICGKKFGYKSSLAEHLAGAHAPAQSHRCGLCGALYARRRGLQRHATRAHGAGRADTAVAPPQGGVDAVPVDSATVL